MDNVADVYTLSPIQQGMLFHTISEPGSGVCIEQICCQLSGALDVPRFQSAWDQLVARYAALRTIFLWEGLDEPLQVVREETALAWTILDWQQYSPAELDQKISAYLTNDRTAGFDLSQAPLIRMTLIQTNIADYRFVWSFHHLLADGWSVALLLKELFERYHALNTNTPPETTESLPYRQFIEYLDHQPLDRAEAFWRDYLAGFHTPTQIAPQTASDTRLTGTGAPYERQQLTISKPLTEQLKSLARDNKVTLNTVILAAWGVVLSASSGDTDLVFGRTVAGRPPVLPHIETAVGLFVNTLPLRLKIGSRSLPEWFNEIQRAQNAISEFEYSPLSQVQKWSEIPRGSALFDSIVVFENYPTWHQHDPDSAEVVASGFDFKEQSNYPLALLVVPDEEISLILIHDGSRYQPSFARGLIERVQQALTEFIENPLRPAGKINCLTPADRDALQTLTNPATPYPEHRPIFKLIETHAKSTPDSIAVQFRDIQLSYAELDRRAERQASRLLDMGASPGDRIGLAVLRGPDLIIGILGIHKIGAAYVPLDPEYPANHLSFVREDAGLRLIVTNQQSVPCLTDVIDPSAFCFIEPDAPDEADRDAPKVQPIDDERLRGEAAYVIYTSGSQGRPKGVVVTHDNLTHSTLARREFYGEPVSSFLLLSSFAFDSSVVGLFWTLADGGKLVLPEPGQEKELHLLSTLIQQHQISHLLTLPGLYGLLCQAGQPEQLQSLQTVIVAGEACDPAVVNQHLAVLPRSRLFNEYGPTEASVWCLAAELTADRTSESIPIGRPIANMSAYLLDHDMNPVPPGVCGELYVGGQGIAKGYLNQDHLTRERFIDNPFDRNASRLYKTGDLAYLRQDGMLVFAGRSDDQVKIRGHRIEPGEIERQLKEHSAVIDAVISIEDLDQDFPANPELDVAQLRERLQAIGPARSKQLIDELLAIPDHELETYLDNEQ